MRIFNVLVFALLSLPLLAVESIAQDYIRIDPIQSGRPLYSWELPYQQPQSSAWWRYQRPTYQSSWSYGWTPYGRGWSQTSVYDLPATYRRCNCWQCRRR